MGGKAVTGRRRKAAEGSRPLPTRQKAKGWHSKAAGRACPAPTDCCENLRTRGAREGGSPPPFPLTGCRGRLRAAYMPPLQSCRLPLRGFGGTSDFLIGVLRGVQPLSRGSRLAAHNERRQFATQTRSCGCLPRRGKHCSLPSFAALNCGPALATPQHPTQRWRKGRGR